MLKCLIKLEPLHLHCIDSFYHALAVLLVHLEHLFEKFDLRVIFAVERLLAALCFLNNLELV